MNFNHKVTSVKWSDEEGRWSFGIRRLGGDSEIDSDGTPDFETSGDIFLYATGVLNDWKYPDVKGLEKFKGRVSDLSKLTYESNNTRVSCSTQPDGPRDTKRSNGERTE